MNFSLSRRSMAGLGAGLVLGLGDYLFLTEVLGVAMVIGERDVTFAVMAMFALSFAALGAVIGRLFDRGEQLTHQAELIGAQYDKLEATHRQLVESEQLAAVGRMAAGVAHEVRNPLGVIRSSAQMVREDLPQASEARRAAGFICEEVDRLDVFVRRLLDLTRPLEVEPETVDLAELADEAAQRACDSRPERPGHVSVSGGSVRAQVDASLLTQLLVGLIDNALVCIDDDGHVEVSVAQSTNGPSIEVADDGPGVASDELEHIFEPFVTTRADGTGLGLVMARKIARVHGGELVCLAGRGLGPGGRGARFRLILPAELTSHRSSETP